MGGRASSDVLWRRVALAFSAALALSTGVGALRPLHGHDLFWHMSLGRAVLRAGARVVPEPSAFEPFVAPRVVPEWLWDVAAYELHHLGGAAAIGLFVALLALAMVLATAWMLSEECEQARDVGPFVLTLAVVVPLAFDRMRERPESAVLVLLPVCVALSRRYRDSGTVRKQALSAALLLVVTLLWAQIHATVLLAIGVFGATVAPCFFARSGRAQLSDAAVCASLTLACLSGAYGAGIVRFVAMHAHGDAVRHIDDMAAPTWALYSMPVYPHGFAYGALLLLALGGAAFARRLWFSEMALAALGLIGFMTAARGISQAAILLAPLLLASFRGVVRQLAFRSVSVPNSVSVVAALAVSSAHLVWLDTYRGGILASGEDMSYLPVAANQFLTSTPPGTRVLSAYAAGGPIGFWQDGHIGTFVDSRTPLHFGDTEYALSRDAFDGAEPTAAFRAIERYRTPVVVSGRSSRMCSSLRAKEGWGVVALDPRFTTFARTDMVPQAKRLAYLVPCGDAFIAPGCESARETAEEVDAAAALLDPSFVHYLAAALAVQCGDPDLSKVRAMLSVERPNGYPHQRALLAAQVSAKMGDTDDALRTLLPFLEQGDLGALALLAPSLDRPADQKLFRRAAVAVVAKLDDATPAHVRVQLAQACVDLNSLDCAAENAFRAAISGDLGALAPLCWLVRHHPDEKTRDESASWIALLRREQAARGGGNGLPDCPQ